LNWFNNLTGRPDHHSFLEKPFLYGSARPSHRGGNHRRHAAQCLGDVDRQLQGYLFSHPLPPEKFEALFIAPETELEMMDTEISAQPQLIGL
jgi:hypothetical protein